MIGLENFKSQKRSQKTLDWLFCFFIQMQPEITLFTNELNSVIINMT